MAGKYHTFGVDPPKVHFENEADIKPPIDLARTPLLEGDSELKRFQLTAEAFIEHLEKRAALQDQINQEKTFHRWKELNQELATTQDQTHQLKKGLEQQSRQLSDRFSRETKLGQFPAPEQTQVSEQYQRQGQNLAQRMEQAALEFQQKPTIEPPPRKHER